MCQHRIGKNIPYITYIRLYWDKHHRDVDLTHNLTFNLLLVDGHIWYIKTVRCFWEGISQKIHRQYKIVRSSFNHPTSFDTNCPQKRDLLMTLLNLKQIFILLDRGLSCLMRLSTIFQLYLGSQFYSCRKALTNMIT